MNLNFFKGINLSKIVSTTNKTLNVIKKSIPVYKEIRPFISKEKKLIPEIKESNETRETKYDNNITFFH
jgi:hypothetical protein